ncbi:putative metal-dependent hydrolase [Flavobacterium sp. ASW18X]|nr:putative metal-dependent hydrolase [Croceivirga sp. JEA036]TKD61439.1 putative metal-dependent hydrolase [Flavobacterium sp. ASW18X]
MQTPTLESLRFPIGKFEPPATITDKEITQWIAELEALPTKLEALVASLTNAQLETPYRPEGWTVRQLIHHISDSHHHSYVRFKWALTENTPLIKAYEEKEWSKLKDANDAPIELSLAHLKAVHAKLVYMLKGFSTQDFEKTYLHPEGNVVVSLKENLGKYAHHGNHHYAHIKNLVEREGW